MNLQYKFTGHLTFGSIITKTQWNSGNITKKKKTQNTIAYGNNGQNDSR